ncbi:UDP-2,3-diacylglucosamine hydrolase [Symmachiella dynata]|uniref:UDP-2,3-diacylglucosamine diphosphatase n=1 Tax=Symmachiella dynata TaxID=2527995 RepID=UPI001188DC63|nr:UDP-2,3-diacylglucosamine diphosphatase [Symmachiella dynata]QDT51907.1 UDP-2,3-diacylglucosamine hydrolase [Symmachiella dynata]
MQRTQGGSRRQVRTVFLSDVHLGSRHSQCQALLDFLEDVTPESLYIVGDLIDGWEMKRSFRWLPSYTRLLQHITALAERGTRIFYLPGNHDDFLRHEDFIRSLIQQLGCVEIAEEFIFKAADDRRFLVTHGDRFDCVEQSAQWLSMGITGIYNVALSLNWWLSRLTGNTKRSPYHLCALAKNRVKAVIRFMSHFEESLMGHAKQQGCQGVICGHLHTPAIVHRSGMTYCNTGDWVENCTALFEYNDGALELEYYYPQAAVQKSPPRRVAATPARPLELARPMLSLPEVTACTIATGDLND